MPQGLLARPLLFLPNHAMRTIVYVDGAARTTPVSALTTACGDTPSRSSSGISRCPALPSNGSLPRRGRHSVPSLPVTHPRSSDGVDFYRFRDLYVDDLVRWRGHMDAGHERPISQVLASCHRIHSSPQVAGQCKMSIQRFGLHQARLPGYPETNVRMRQQPESVGPIVQFTQHPLVGAESLYTVRHHDRRQPPGGSPPQCTAGFPVPPQASFPANLPAT